MWKEAADSKFGRLDWHFPEEIKEDHGKFSQDTRPGRDSNPASPDIGQNCYRLS
jgi:hypothetical protein